MLGRSSIRTISAICCDCHGRDASTPGEAGCQVYALADGPVSHFPSLITASDGHNPPVRRNTSQVVVMLVATAADRLDRRAGCCRPGITAAKCDNVATSCLIRGRSGSGAKGTRTPDLLVAKVALPVRPPHLSGACLAWVTSRARLGRDPYAGGDVRLNSTQIVGPPGLLGCQGSWPEQRRPVDPRYHRAGPRIRQILVT